MHNPNILKGKIVENGMSVPQFARKVGIAPVTFYRKMKNFTFTIPEAAKICDELHIEDPVAKCEIFLPSASQK